MGSIGAYDKRYVSSGPNFRTGREMTETSFELHGVHGVAEGWTVACTLPVRSVDGGALVSPPTTQPATIQGDTLTALGNISVGVRKQLATGN